MKKIYTWNLLLSQDFGSNLFSDIDNCCHMCWATGGSLVPTYEKKRDYEKALSLLKSQ